MIALVAPTHDENWEPDFAASHDYRRLSSLVDSIDNGEEVATLINDLGLTFSLQAVEDFRVGRSIERSEALDKEHDKQWRHRYESSLVTPSIFPRAPYLRPSLQRVLWRPSYWEYALSLKLSSC